jgi:hypothetical protein
MARRYTARIDISAATTQRDIVEVIAGSAKPIAIRELYITTDVETDASEEQIFISIARRTGAVSSGSGGTEAVAGRPHNPTDAAAGATVDTGHTTQASGGTLETISEPYMNNRIGLHMAWPEDPYVIPATDMFVVGMQGTVTNSVAFGGHITFDELA